MNSLYRIVVVLAAIIMIGSTGASLQQQASAQGVIVNYKEQFTKLTDDFEKAVLGALDEGAGDPPSERIQAFLIEYDNNVKALFELEPPDPDAQPPDPDLEPPDPDKS